MGKLRAAGGSGLAASPRLRTSAGFAASLLAIGFLLSVVAGFAACDAFGPYGDGPFGAGFRRIPIESTGGTLLVHDGRIGSDTMRSVIDEETGRVSELQLAPGGDVTKAVRIHLDDERGARIARDLDGDGVADRWEYYADVVQIGSGAVEAVGYSLAGDEIVDTWVSYDEQGQVSRVEVSTARDGVVDRWEHYRAGELERVEIDRDRDGRVDSSTTYRGGILSAATADTDGNPRPDLPPAATR